MNTKEEIKKVIVNRYQVIVDLIQYEKAGIPVGVANDFAVSNDENNILDFYYLCFDVVAGIVNKSITLHKLPQIHETFDEPIDQQYLMHEIDKYRHTIIELIAEKNRQLHELKNLNENPDEN